MHCFATSATKRMKKEKESDIIAAIMQYLAHRKVFFWRQNTGAFTDARGHFYRFSVSGAPDIIVVKYGRCIGIEAKTRHGKQSEAQKTFQKQLEQAGGLYILARSVEDIQKRGI